jgi:hypothetical protein
VVDWFLNPALTTFRAEVDTEYSKRDRESDGTIGDQAHMGTSSDHNPDSDGSVDAWDMDVNLFGASKGIPWDHLERLKDLFERHDAAQYWIHDGIICSRSTGWVRERYTGSNPHDKHIHWNTRSSHEHLTSTWGVETEMDQDTFNERMDNYTISRFGTSTLTGNPLTARNLWRGVMWQYVGGGIPAGMSILAVQNEQLLKIRTMLERLDTIAAEAGGSPEIAAIVAAIKPIVRDAVADGLEGGSEEVRADDDGDTQ